MEINEDNEKKQKLNKLEKERILIKKKIDKLDNFNKIVKRNPSKDLPYHLINIL